jgi:putative amide transporter protein
MIFSVLVVVALILFTNGLVVLGRFGGKQVAVLNLAVGIGIGIMGLFIGFTDALKVVGPTQSYVALASCLVFALTYILLAGEIYAGTDFKALGWYCCIAGITMFLMGLGFFHILGTTLVLSSQFGVLWLLWAVLFWLFWACWGLGKAGWAKFTGYYTIFVAFFTALYPAIAFFNFGKIGW